MFGIRGFDLDDYFDYMASSGEQENHDSESRKYKKIIIDEQVIYEKATYNHKHNHANNNLHSHAHVNAHTHAAKNENPVNQANEDIFLKLMNVK